MSLIHFARVYHDPSAILDLTEKQQTERLWCTAVRKNADIIQHIHATQWTQRIANLAIEVNPHTIVYIPDQYLTELHAIQAVRKDGTLVCFLPNKLRTRAIAMRVLKQFPLFFTQFHPDIVGDDDYERAIRASPHYVAHIPPERMKQHFANLAFECLPDVAYDLPARYVQYDIMRYLRENSEPTPITKPYTLNHVRLARKRERMLAQ